MKAFKVIFCLAGMLFATGLAAQISEGGKPYTFVSKVALEKTTVPFVEMRSVSNARLFEEDERSKGLEKPMRFGLEMDVDINIANSGKWDELPGGDRLWRVGIRSRGALSINLIFKKYKLPSGAKLFIYSEDRSMVIGAFTEKNNLPHEGLGTVPVKGDAIIVEYYEPKEVKGEGKIAIGKVVHAYRDIYKIQKALGFGQSGACNKNVNCPEGAAWVDQKRSVALIVAGGGFCTGALVNNTLEDGRPYFLTADHCFTSGSVRDWVFVFNYESPNCINSDGEITQSIAGSFVRARNSSSDFLLLELSFVPPSSYNAFYAGWSNVNSAGSSAVSIHHPSGDIKKISFENNAPVSSTVNSSPANSHWRVQWDESTTTEPGSSGSPLFDQNKRIIGQLHGGSAACDNLSGFDWYGKFSYSWNTGASSASRLRDWLDPLNSGLTTLNGKNITPSGVYCPSGAIYNDDSKIDRVVFGEIDITTSASECATFRNFTWHSPIVMPGETISLSVTAGTCSGNYDKKVKIYIDWNDDQEFDEVTELIGESAVSKPAFTFTTDVEIPEDMEYGFKRVRIICFETGYNSDVGPCEMYYYGETQDYTFNVGGVASNEDKFEELEILMQNYPNPFTGSTIIPVNIFKGSVATLEVLNVLGERVSLVKDGFWEMGKHKIELSDIKLPAGTYFYRLQMDGRSWVKRMVVN